MRHCEFCATELPDHTTFCWHCGQAPTSSTEALTDVSISQAGNLPVEEVTTAPDLPTASLPVRTDLAEDAQEQNAVTTISIADNPTLPHIQPVLENQASTNADTDEEEEDEKRRRAAMIGPGLSLLGKVVTRAPSADVPVVQSTPQFKGVPSVQGTPHIAQAPHMPTIPKWQISRLPTYPSVPAVHNAAPAQPAAPAQSTAQHGTMPPPPQPAHPHPGPHAPGARQSGCVPGLIVAGVTCLLIVASIIGLGFTILSPSLSLGGSTNVAWGESIHLHGSNFIPGSTVLLTFDGTAPLYYTSRNPATQVSYSTITTAGLDTIEEQFAQDSSAKNSVVISGNGTFNVSVIVNPSWHAGRHFIRASEEISPRSAQLTFTIQQPGTSSTATPSPTPLTLGLSCVQPASIAPAASAGDTQPVSQKVTLCTAGSGAVSWTANWDHNAAPWLQLDHTSGKINAPGQGQVKVSTLAASLKPGKYTTAITFSSQPGGSQVSLAVSFTIQAGCVSVTPGTFKVSGAIGVTQAQTVTVSNCGNAVGSWSAATSASWLKVSPASGTLNAGAAQKVTISMSQGKVGTFTAQGTFTLGESQSAVHVTLKVQAPTLSVNPSSLDANRNCTLDSNQTDWVCQVTVTNDGNVHASLNWSTNRTSNVVSISPASGTLAAGASVQVEVDISFNGCPDGAGFVFIGPANSVTVSWIYNTCSGN